MPYASWRPLRPSPPASRPRSAAAGAWEARRTWTNVRTACGGGERGGVYGS